MKKPNLDTLLVLFVRIGTFLCFAGWTWQHFYWEGPYGILLWQESTYALAERFGIDWDAFVGSGADDGLVQKWIAWMAWPFLVCTILTLTVRRGSWIQMAGLVMGSGLLAVVAYAEFVEAQRQLPMLIEYGGQVLSPILLVLALALGIRHRATIITAMVAVVLIFAGHGFYALGVWPTPSTFYGMTSVILGVEHEAAKTILRVAGVLDFVVCIGILVPAARRSCALYAAVWGFLTAIARPVAGMSADLNYWGADQFLHEAVLRAPHFLIPLYLFFVWRRPAEDKPLAPAPESTSESGDSPNVETTELKPT